MSITMVLFYIFSIIMLLSSFCVITTKNPVHAVLFLVLAFFQASMIWMLLQAEFLSIALVLVYVGAVMVLFLFVVMMLDIKIEKLRLGFWKNFPIALFVGTLVSLEMIAVLMGNFLILDNPPSVTILPVVPISNTKELGVLMYTKYIYPLEIATAILLVAVISAIALTLRNRKDVNKYISPSEQVRVRASERLIILKQSATKDIEGFLVENSVKKDIL